MNLNEEVLCTRCGNIELYETPTLSKPLKILFLSLFVISSVLAIALLSHYNEVAYRGRSSDRIILAFGVIFTVSGIISIVVFLYKLYATASEKPKCSLCGADGLIPSQSPTAKKYIHDNKIR